MILMRGIPGSGKSYTAKLIKEKEQEMGGSVRILSIDDYFMTETDDENQGVSFKVRKYSIAIDSNILLLENCRHLRNNCPTNMMPAWKKRTHNISSNHSKKH